MAPLALHETDVAYIMPHYTKLTYGKQQIQIVDIHIDGINKSVTYLCISADSSKVCNTRDLLLSLGWRKADKNPPSIDEQAEQSLKRKFYSTTADGLLLRKQQHSKATIDALANEYGVSHTHMRQAIDNAHNSLRLYIESRVKP